MRGVRYQAFVLADESADHRAACGAAHIACRAAIGDRGAIRIESGKTANRTTAAHVTGRSRSGDRAVVLRDKAADKAVGPARDIAACRGRADHARILADESTRVIEAAAGP